MGIWDMECLGCASQCDTTLKLTHLEIYKQKILAPRSQCLNQGNGIMMCVPIHYNKNLSMLILTQRYLRTELYSQRAMKATQISFKITVKETELHMKSFGKCLKI